MADKKKPVRPPSRTAGLLQLPVEGVPARQAGLLSYEPTLREKIANAVYDGSVGLLGKRKAHEMQANTKSAVDFVPGLGDAVGANDMARDYRAGNYGMAALSAIGLIPAVGDVASKAGKKALKVYHGSPRLDLTDLRPSVRGPLGPGVYASPQQNLANRYAGAGGKAYEFEADGFFNGMGRAGVGPDDNPFQIWRDQTAKLIEAAPAEKREKIAAIVGKLSSDDGYRLYGDIVRELGGDAPAQSLFKSAGFKGISGNVDGPEINMFDPVGLANAPEGIRAFHGSPHSFDKFSLDKIGTGEGAQAYGHGLYFAENEGVAKGYRDNLKAYDSAASSARWALSEANGDPADAIEKLQASMDFKLSRGELTDVDKATHIDAISRIKNGSVDGSMYEVNIRANPDDFLDWDKPLSEQPQKVREALTSFGAKPDEAGQNAYYRTAKMTYPIKGPDGKWIQGGKTYEDSLAMAGGDPKKVNRLMNGFPADKTEALREAGIPGIKYLDAGSRGAGDGSRNYVVFDEKLIDIVRKYGLASAIGAGIISKEMGQQMQAQGDI